MSQRYAPNDTVPRLVSLAHRGAIYDIDRSARMASSTSITGAMDIKGNAYDSEF